ncbi:MULTISPECIES: DUF1659 domain-containing protein [Evansella]|jgi:hypothetical protein|uniref:DUF1659 domain-containing protein n=1 Tax=Evansella TaxID=2837485 RepID=UPI0009968DCA|nr:MULTISPECIES: DUF1659 domain-containing protein [Evansella]UTR11194.1 DUF1659 domain-containing protein [Evansella sp. LMS18]
MGDLTSTRLSVVYIADYTTDGDPVFKVRQFRNILPQASNENLFNAAVAISSLQQHELHRVERNNSYELAE